jgi:hypothetical protein
MQFAKLDRSAHVDYFELRIRLLALGQFGGCDGLSSRAA